MITNVLDVAVKDGAGIGWFDVGGLAYEPDREELRLRSNVPLGIRVHVRRLDVELLRP